MIAANYIICQALDQNQSATKAIFVNFLGQLNQPYSPFYLDVPGQPSQSANH